MSTEFLNPKEVIKKLELKKDMVAVDFGSGSGGWAIPLAERFEDGNVYAIDILKEPLSALKAKAELEKTANIQIIQADVEGKRGSTLSDCSVDLVLMTNLLFQAEKKKEVFEEAKRILKNEGRILVVDWKPESPLGPAEGRVPPKEVKKIAETFGFKLEKEFEAGSHHYGLIFKKSL